MATGGQKLVEQIHAEGARRVFCVAGESYLPVLDALLDFPDVDIVTCRQEGGAAFMAEAYGAMTGEPGIVMVTRGPGACNASIGVHAAMQASTPLIMLVGLVATSDRDKEAFQEFDLKMTFGPLCKWAAVIEEPERAAEYIARAYHVAMSGRMGPVVLGLPENILNEEAGKAGALPSLPKSRVSPAAAQVKAVADALKEASKPLILAGGSGWSDDDCANLAAFSSSAHLPVACSFRRQDVFSHSSGNYIGELGTGPNPALVKRVGEADCVLVIGARLTEITTQGYTLFTEGQKIIHIHPELLEFGKGAWPAIGVQADISEAVAALAAGPRIDGRDWAGWRDDARADYMAWSEIETQSESDWNGADMTQIFRQLRDLLPADAVITTDAGNFSGWAQRYVRYGRPGRLLAPISGAMGYAVPSAVSASLAYPDRVVLGLCGDGGFMMTGQELATAIHAGAKPIIMVCNNGMYGTIRMHQERDFPGRQSATALTNPDFKALAESYGAFGACITDAADFEEVWKAALESGKPAILEIQMDPRQITTNAKP